MQRKALGDDNWGNWEIEDASLYNGVWLYSLLGYADALGRMADLFRTPEMVVLRPLFPQSHEPGRDDPRLRRRPLGIQLAAFPGVFRSRRGRRPGSRAGLGGGDDRPQIHRLRQADERRPGLHASRRRPLGRRRPPPAFPTRCPRKSWRTSRARRSSFATAGSPNPSISS